jgi:hypothetical protein
LFSSSSFNILNFQLATLKFDLAEASKSYDEAVTQLSHRENAHKALEKEVMCYQ